MEGQERVYLTVKDRILLHLLDYAKHTDDPQMPPETTREGIARASWIDIRHVPQNVRPLIRDGFVVERTTHVKGGNRRRKTYCLTGSGIQEAAHVRLTVGAQTQRIRAGSGFREATLSDIVQETGGRWSLLEIARRSLAGGTLDLSTLASAPSVSDGNLPSPRFVEILQNAPHIDGFVGRHRELAALDSEGVPRVIVIQGPAGIGKSWFGAKACELRHGRNNLFWHRVRSWDTPQSILASLGDFLHALGRSTLRSVIVRGDGALVRRILHDDLPGTNALLVFDDAHEATPDTLSLLRDIKETVGSSTGVRVLVLTRRSLPFYDRRDVTLNKTVIELDLRGLEMEDFSSLFQPDGEGVALLNLGRKLGGHPLLIELTRAMGHPASAGEYLRDARRFLQEEVYRELTEAERRMMKLAALYRTPVSRESLFGGPELTYDVLVSLQTKALIRGAGWDAFEVHDTIRDFFDSILTDGERVTLGRFAADQLRTLAARAEAARDYPTCIDCLSNALQLLVDTPERVALSEALGDAYQWVGDLPQTLTVYKEALAWTKDPETSARLHRKAARALRVRGENGAAWREVGAGLEALGTMRSVERGWLELLGAFVAPSVHQDGDQPLSPIRAAIDIFREFGEERGEADALLSLGAVLLHAPECDLVEGERLLEAGLRRAISRSDETLITKAHSDMVHLYIGHRPDPERAMAHVAAAESSARDLDPFTRSNVAYWKAFAQAELLEDYAGAEANLKEVIVLARRTHDAEGAFRAKHGLANLEFYRERFAEARRQHEALWQESKAEDWFEFKWAAHSLWTAAECCLLQRDRDGFDRLVAEAEGPGVKDRVSERIVVLDVLLGLAGYLRGDETQFESNFSHGLKAAESAWKTRAPPLQFDPYLVPFFYGVTLRARGREDEAAPHIARALDVPRTYKMQARLQALQRDEDAFVEVLRGWAPSEARRL